MACREAVTSKMVISHLNAISRRISTSFWYHLKHFSSETKQNKLPITITSSPNHPQTPSTCLTTSQLSTTVSARTASQTSVSALASSPRARSTQSRPARRVATPLAVTASRLLAVLVARASLPAERSTQSRLAARAETLK